MAERNSAGNEPRPALRIAGYVQGHAEPVADAEPSPTAEPGPRQSPASVPNIADYWPDARPQRPTSAPPGPTAAPGAFGTARPTGQAGPFGTARPTGTAGTPDPTGGLSPFGLSPEGANHGRPNRPARNRRPAMVAGALAGVVTVGTLLLARPLTRTSQEPVAGPATVPASVAPAVVPTVSASPAASPSPSVASPAAPPPEAPSPPPATTTPPPPAITAARFELATGVTELSVRTADLDGEQFRVTTPQDSGLDVDASFKDGTLRVSARPDGAENGSGRVDVLLSADIVWNLRMGAGVRVASFDMADGTVSEVDLIGGVQTVDLKLGRLDRTVPILMAGGVRTWRIRTSDEVPVKLAIVSGAGAVAVYGDDRGGVSAGATLRFGDRDRPGLDIDAEAGFGSLKITRG